jgi:hypothetical protein
MKTDREARVALGLELLLSAAVFTAFLLADGLGSALFAGALLVSFTLVLYFGRTRSETVEVMTGIGDERTRAIATTAAAWTAHVMVTILIGWWLVALATGADETVQRTLGQLGALYAIAWLICTLVAKRRS